MQPIRSQKTTHTPDTHTHAHSIHICRCYGSTANSNPAAASHSGLTFCHLAQRLSKKQKQSGKKNKKDGNKIHDTITHTHTHTYTHPHTPSHTSSHTHENTTWTTLFGPRCEMHSHAPLLHLCLTSCYPRELYNKHEYNLQRCNTRGQERQV